MKQLLISLLLIVCVPVFSQTISIFESKGDVLVFLNNRGDFTNSNNGVTLSFSDMGGRMRSNKGVDYFNPDVTLLSRTRAIVTYESLTSGGIAKIIVDCKENVIADRNDNTVYSPESSSKDPINESKVESEPTPQEPSIIIGVPIRIGNLVVAQYNFTVFGRNWDGAKKACAALGKGWRLPTKGELNILYQNRKKIGEFGNKNYWSSTESGKFTAWMQDFSDGRMSSEGKGSVGAYSVRAVKSFTPIIEKNPILNTGLKGQSPDLFSNAIIGNSFRMESLVVAQNDFPNEMNWDNANKACANLGDGWRLPTQSELDFLFQRKDEIGRFGSSAYWSSRENEYGQAVSEIFFKGDQYFRQKSERNLVRAVRNLRTFEEIDSIFIRKIIGEPFRVGNLIVAQNDFPKSRNWDYANKACTKLGDGWRLPTKDELNFLYQNIDKVPRFFRSFYGDSHWSSSEVDLNNAWYINIEDGRWHGCNKTGCKLLFRAVKSL